jgi:hypothetical protein
MTLQNIQRKLRMTSQLHDAFGQTIGQIEIRTAPSPRLSARGATAIFSIPATVIAPEKRADEFGRQSVIEGFQKGLQLGGIFALDWPRLLRSAS